MAGAAASSEGAAFRKARQALSRRDERLKGLIERVGPCTLQPNTDVFPVLVRTIIAQQLSTKAATTISDRLQALARGRMTPQALERLSDDAVRGCGLSAAKLKSVRDLCRRVLAGDVPIRRLADMSDDEVRAALLPVFGIGPWSVDMYLIFCLGRLDVLPVGDLGLRHGVRDLYELAEAPDPEELVELADPWRPYRTVATWYVWRSRGAVPQS